MGGWRGMLESVLPSLVFLLIYTRNGRDLVLASRSRWASRRSSPSCGSSTKSPPNAAIGGLIATVAAAALALWTGEARRQLRLGLRHEHRLRHGVPDLGAHRLAAHRPRRRLPDGRGHQVARGQAQAARVLLARRSRGRACSSHVSRCSCRSTSPATSRPSEPEAHHGHTAVRAARRGHLARRAGALSTIAEVIHLS